jgi:hypothetical protein
MWKVSAALLAACFVTPAFATDAVAPPGTCVSPAMFQAALDFMGDWTVFRDPRGPIAADTRAIVFRDGGTINAAIFKGGCLAGAVVLAEAPPDRRI